MSDQEEKKAEALVEEPGKESPDTEQPEKVEEHDGPLEEQEDRLEPDVKEDHVEPEEKEQPQPSRRESLRIQQLLDKLKAKEAKAEPPKSEGIDYRKMIEADDPVYEQLDQASQEFGARQFNAGLEQAKSIQFHTRLEIDAPKVESKYPQFDKESPEFDPVLANSVNQWFLTTVGYDPKRNTVENGSVRYAEFVEGIMELGEVIAGKKNMRSTQNIARQAATTGLRPDGSSPKKLDLNKAPQDMSDDELKAVIARSLPKR